MVTRKIMYGDQDTSNLKSASLGAAATDAGGAARWWDHCAPA